MPQYELSLTDYIRIVRKRKWVIVFSFIIFTAFAVFYAFSKPPVYEAVARVKIQEHKTVAGLLTEWITYSPGDLLESQAKFITSFPVMKAAALKMEMITPDMLSGGPDEDHDPRVYQATSRLQNSITTVREGQSNIIKIIATAATPDRAVEIARAVADAYRQQNQADKRRQATNAREFIENQLSTLEKKLHDAEEKMRQFSDEVKDIEIAEDVQKKLMDLQFEMASLLRKFTSKHPKVVQTQKQIADMEKQLEGFSDSQLKYARLKREVEVNKSIYAMLREKLEEARIRENEKVSDVSIVDPAILSGRAAGAQSKLAPLMGAFLGLVVGMILAFVAENLDTSIGTIEDVESVAQLPVLGVIPSMEGEGGQAPGGLLGGMRRSFLRGRLSREEERRIRLISHIEPSCPVAEMFRHIKTNMKFSPTLKSVLITSTGPEEGKTTIMTNIGLVSAQAGFKVLLTSADLRRPALADTFGLERKPGLADILMGTTTLENATRNVSDVLMGEVEMQKLLGHPGLDRLWILPSGTLPSNPAELLNSPQMGGLLGRLRNDFDIVLIDCPPVLPVADPSILAAKVDGVVFCYEMDRTSRHALVRAKQQLETASAQLLGIILNHTRPETQLTRGAYPYYYKYYGGEKGKPTENA
jgi:capsular exopolysaccharide synthesis family protein